ncbi:hypothetical protein FOMPIDRAFT_1053394 [Fomitopsis schrenkii]|uniref:Uncharacterized protein n=1 Tax=Fomitopsis schrenkii TaxID=2126942 RepID=S8F3C2_FOMSC|nr:hypothetical protein FOMPIDRAFT_1053394 [Fomitopsis schrenkii]
MQTRSLTSHSAARPLSLPPSLPSNLASPPSPTLRDGRSFAQVLNGELRTMTAQPAQATGAANVDTHNAVQQSPTPQENDDQTGSATGHLGTTAGPVEEPARMAADENEPAPLQQRKKQKKVAKKTKGKGKAKATAQTAPPVLTPPTTATEQSNKTAAAAATGEEPVAKKRRYDENTSTTDMADPLTTQTTTGESIAAEANATPPTVTPVSQSAVTCPTSPVSRGSSVYWEVFDTDPLLDNANQSDVTNLTAYGTHWANETTTSAEPTLAPVVYASTAHHPHSTLPPLSPSKLPRNRDLSTLRWQRPAPMWARQPSSSSSRVTLDQNIEPSDSTYDLFWNGPLQGDDKQTQQVMFQESMSKPPPMITSNVRYISRRPASSSSDDSPL